MDKLHPCTNNCCENPQVITPDHKEPEDGEFCEECYYLECLYCGKGCYCNL